MMKVEIEFEVDRIHGEEEEALHAFLASLIEPLDSHKRVYNLNMFYDPGQDEG